MGYVDLLCAVVTSLQTDPVTNLHCALLAGVQALAAQCKPSVRLQRLKAGLQRPMPLTSATK